MYKKENKLVKQNFAYKLPNYSMSETLLKLYGPGYIHKHLSKRYVSAIPKEKILRRTKALNYDAEFQVPSGKYVHFIDLKTATKIIYNYVNVLHNSVDRYEGIRGSIIITNKVGLSQLVILLRDHMKKNGIQLIVANNTNITFPESSNVSSYIVPTLDEIVFVSDVF